MLCLLHVNMQKSYFIAKARQTATCSAAFGCVWRLKLDFPTSPTNGPWACLEVLAGERSNWYTDDRSSVWGTWSSSTERGASGGDAHGTVREEGDTRLASQISRINPSDQWGDRCRSQIRPHIQQCCTSTLYYIAYQSDVFLTHGALFPEMQAEKSYII